MSRLIKCLRCGADMAFIRREKLQLGQTGFFLGDWPNIIAGSMDVEIYGCHKCGKVELYMPGYPEPEYEEPAIEELELPPEADQNIVGVSMDGTPLVRCPKCRRRHDFDYPRCPHCGHVYE